jgi:hypothetical protein
LIASVNIHTIQREPLTTFFIHAWEIRLIPWQIWQSLTMFLSWQQRIVIHM